MIENVDSVRFFKMGTHGYTNKYEICNILLVLPRGPGVHVFSSVKYVGGLMLARRWIVKLKITVTKRLVNTTFGVLISYRFGEKKSQG